MHITNVYKKNLPGRMNGLVSCIPASLNQNLVAKFKNETASVFQMLLLENSVCFDYFSLTKCFNVIVVWHFELSGLARVFANAKDFNLEFLI